MSAIREPVAAGSFYPADTRELADLVDRLLAAARPALPAGALQALVAPHAGYLYSGAAAAAAFAALPAEATDLRVALLGPSHFVPLAGAAVSGAGAWRTPLGPVPVDEELRAVALAAGAVVDERPHADDHALEVELPFLQRRAGPGLRILPIALGGDRGTAELLAALAPETLLVVSTDLSHYHDDTTARQRDRRTADAVLALDGDAVGDRDACGSHALRALLRHARRDGWRPTMLDLRTSADTTGDTHRVVGYGAFALTAERQEAHVAGRP